MLNFIDHLTKNCVTFNLDERFVVTIKRRIAVDFESKCIGVFHESH